jgi:hypothetical protein
LNYTAPPAPGWNATYDSGGTDYAMGVDVDSQDNVIVVGQAVFGGNYDYNTIKYSSNGSQLWSINHDEGGFDKARGIAVDSNDNIIVTGRAYNAAGGSTNDDYMTVKYDSNGIHLWNVSFCTLGSDIAAGVAVDSNDNVIVTGFDGSGSGPSFGDYYTIKYDNNGNQLWNRTFDSGTYDTPFGVAVDSSDNVIVTGRINGSDNAADYFTIKYDSSGNHLWNKSYNGGYFDEATAVAVDSSDNVIVTGRSYLTPGSISQYLTIKYDSSGNQLWMANYTTNDVDAAFGVDVDSQDNIIVTGRINGTGAGADAFTIKYDSSGNQIWNATYDVLVIEQGEDVAIDSNDRIIVAGHQTGDWFTVKY